jgi:hypothetical protein
MTSKSKDRGRCLSAEEMAKGQLKRRASVLAIYLLCPVSLAAMLLAVYSWLRTIGMTVRFVRFGAIEFLEAGNLSLFDRLLWLDISTMSALIALLLSLFLLIGTASVISQYRRARDWRDFNGRVYEERLLPQSLGPVAIRLGLIGTLISFVLIAMVLFRDPAALGRDAGPTGAAALPGVTGSATGPSDGATPVGGEAPQPSGDTILARSGRTSSQVFLLLCASLYSTLVGCTVGYFVVPVLDRVGECAAGRAQISQREADLAEQQYVSRLEQASRELALLAEQSNSVQAAAVGLAKCVEAIRETQTYLATVRREMMRGVQDAREAQKIAQEMTHAAGDLRGACQSIERASDFYQQQVNEAKLVGSGLQDAASRAAGGLTDAIGDLKGVAESMRKDALAPTGELVGSLTSLVGGLKDNIKSLLRTQSAQEELTRGAANSVTACTEPIARATKKVTAVANELKELARAGADAQQDTKQTVEGVRAGVQDVQSALRELRELLEELRAQRTELSIELASGQRGCLGAGDEARQAGGPAALGAPLAESGGRTRRGFLRRLFGRGSGRKKGGRR